MTPISGITALHCAPMRAASLRENQTCELLSIARSHGTEHETILAGYFVQSRIPSGLPLAHVP
jgi:hypothetical protein